MKCPHCGKTLEITIIKGICPKEPKSPATAHPSPLKDNIKAWPKRIFTRKSIKTTIYGPKNKTAYEGEGA